MRDEEYRRNGLDLQTFMDMNRDVERLADEKLMMEQDKDRATTVWRGLNEDVDSMEATICQLLPKHNQVIRLLHLSGNIY